LALVAAVTLFIVVSGALAQATKPLPRGAATWNVTKVTGMVELYSPGGAKEAPKIGSPIATGFRIATGSGTASLARGHSTIELSEDSELELGQDGTDGPITLAIQTFGTVDFRVKAPSSRRFEVETPFLLATATAAVFTISVQSTGGVVHVREGTVQVTSQDGGAPVLVRSGQSATVPAKTGSPVELLKRSSIASPTGLV